MERDLGLEVHAASCTLAVISQPGKRLTDFPIEINGHALVEAIGRIPGRNHLVFEESPSPSPRLDLAHSDPVIRRSFAPRRRATSPEGSVAAQ